MYHVLLPCSKCNRWDKIVDQIKLDWCTESSGENNNTFLLVPQPVYTFLHTVMFIMWMFTCCSKPCLHVLLEVIFHIYDFNRRCLTLKADSQWCTEQELMLTDSTASFADSNTVNRDRLKEIYLISVPERDLNRAPRHPEGRENSPKVDFQWKTKISSRCLICSCNMRPVGNKHNEGVTEIVSGEVEGKGRVPHVDEFGQCSLVEIQNECTGKDNHKPFFLLGECCHFTPQKEFKITSLSFHVFQVKWVRIILLIDCKENLNPTSSTGWYILQAVSQTLHLMYVNPLVVVGSIWPDFKSYCHNFSSFIELHTNYTNCFMSCHLHIKLVISTLLNYVSFIYRKKYNILLPWKKLKWFQINILPRLCHILVCDNFFFLLEKGSTVILARSIIPYITKLIIEYTLQKTEV